MDTIQTETKSKRLMSIDAVRGLDMLFISGGGAFISKLHGVTGHCWIDALAVQMEHAEWNGFTFFDFIFPLFLFISGVSLTFSLTRNLEKGATKKFLYEKEFKRMVILIILGLIYKNTPIHIFEPSTLRYSSVLGRIGIATFVTTLLFLNFNSRQRLMWAFGILLAYYAAMFLVPVPGYGAGNLTLEGNFAGWIDRMVVPGRLKQGVFDENGFTTDFPALVITIFGAWAGEMLRNKNTDDRRKLLHMATAGIALMAIGLVWGLHFPINKHLWSSSFISLTSGMAFLTMALFYWLIEVRSYRKWAFAFVVIGMNSLAMYYINHFVDFRHTAHRLFDGVLVIVDKSYHPSIIAFIALILLWFVLYCMYRKKIFIKV